MNKYRIGKLLLLPLLLGTFGACSDFDAVPLEYKEDPAFDVDPAWELELLGGQPDDRVVVYKDKKYDKLFTRTLGWNGGDGVLTTLLPDGNAFWSFNDSWYGVIDGEQRLRDGNKVNFPRNTIMVQTPGDEDENLIWLADFIQTNDPKARRYYQARTHIRNPKASRLTEAQIQEGEIDQDWLYWAGDATVYNNQLQVLWNGVDNTDPNNQMRHEGICLAIYSLEGKPGDGNYMKMLSANHNFNPVDI